MAPSRDKRAPASAGLAAYDAGEVVPGLWVGGLAAAEDSQNLLARRIVKVLSVGTRLNPQLAWSAKASDSIAFKGFEIEDHPCADILGVLPEAMRHIDKVMKARESSETTGCGVLVHCASGMSRSVSVCMAWLMLRQDLQVAEALQKVKDARPQALPNHGFVQSLELLQGQQGDLRAAHKLWQKANSVSGDCRDRLVIKLREKSDKLAERAAELEEKLQRARSGGDDRTLAKLVKSLRHLSQDIEKGKPVSTIDDGVAQNVRRITGEKVDHLLRLWEHLAPAEPGEDSSEVEVEPEDAAEATPPAPVPEKGRSVVVSL